MAPSLGQAPAVQLRLVSQRQERRQAVLFVQGPQVAGVWQEPQELGQLVFPGLWEPQVLLAQAAGRQVLRTEILSQPAEHPQDQPTERR